MSESDLEFWESNRFDILRKIIYLKFEQNIPLSELLLGTGHRRIAEA